MSLNRYDKRRDENEAEIIKEFQRHGMSVYRLDTPLDLLVGYDNRNFLVEVKMKTKKLNKNQREFAQEWKGQHIVCSSIHQANRFIRQILQTKANINESKK